MGSDHEEGARVPVTVCRDFGWAAPIRWMMTDNRAVGLVAPWQAVRGTREAVGAVVDPASDRCRAPAESAESPHCIALQVATVRYSVDEKPTVTCDNAQSPWSDDGRYLLCKQKAVGSSPTVSTT